MVRSKARRGGWLTAAARCAACWQLACVGSDAATDSSHITAHVASCRPAFVLAVAGLLAVLFLTMFQVWRASEGNELQRDNSQELLLDYSAFGVQRYSIPGELGSGTECALPGTLHVYLKALRWPVRCVPVCVFAGGAAA